MNSFKIILTALIITVAPMAYAQVIQKGDYDSPTRPRLQFFRPNNAQGLNTFENPKEDTVDYNGVAVRIGGDFAMQFQALSQSNAFDTGAMSLVELGQDFNLPTANLNLDVQLYDGVKLHLRTYLSSRHHTESWVKGGNLQIDKLDFIKKGFAEDIMKVLRFRVGLDEINYGDAHFRRTDNARAIYNPFVGNYLMDAFTTEVFGEAEVQLSNGFLGVLGVSNGKLNQSVVVNDKTDNGPSIYGKLGYDNNGSDGNVRFRLTGSAYYSSTASTGNHLYGGDRSGSRYYSATQTMGDAEAPPFSGRFNPRFNKITAFQVNPFVKYSGLEFFGIFEMAMSGDEKMVKGESQKTEGSYTQLAGELLYRFGNREQFYFGGRYNMVTGKPDKDADDQQISRINVGGGWYLTKNILTKVEYVNQTYSKDGFKGTYLQDAEFSGAVVEAAISF